MQIIPVIDLMNNVVVHARHGNRASYQPIQTTLSVSADPITVINGFLELYSFNTVYIADLNQLSTAGNNIATIKLILSQFPDIQFWIDQGKLLDADQLPDNWIQVIGTESLTDAKLPVVTSGQTKIILSLDFSHSLIGSCQWLETAHQWPQQVIAMTLNKVGSNTGPDWELLKTILQLTKYSQVIAAGGIRGKADLIKLSEMGIHRALLATALHSGQLTSNDLHLIVDNCQYNHSL